MTKTIATTDRESDHGGTEETDLEAAQAKAPDAPRRGEHRSPGLPEMRRSSKATPGVSDVRPLRRAGDRPNRRVLTGPRPSQV